MIFRKQQLICLNLNTIIFLLERSRKLNKSLEGFMRRKAMVEMKKLDDLGSKQAPVPLIFLKFMIDKQKHQWPV